jgi:hypothetical protein
LRMRVGPECWIPRLIVPRPFPSRMVPVPLSLIGT